MERNLSLDILKICLAIFVVFLHTGFFYDISKEISFLLVHGLFRIAVPTFLLITGYYFFLITTKDKFLKWLSRVIILFLIWNIFYLPLWYDSKLPMVLFNAFNGYFVLWYLSGTAIAGCMLFLLKEVRSKYLIISSLLIYVAGWLIQEIGNLHIFSGVIDTLLNFTPLHRNFFFICFPFLTLGFLLHKHQAYVNKFNINGRIILLCLIVLIIESYLNYIFIGQKEVLDQLLALFFFVPVLFLYILKLEIKGKNKDLASLSTAIFLIHPLFLFLFKDYINEQQITLFSFIVLSVSVLAGLFLVYINKRLKYIL